MLKIEYTTSKNTSSTIYINHSYKHFKEIVGNRKIAIISCKNVIDNYPDISSEENLIVIDDRENCKNLKSVENIIGKLLEMGIDRNSFIIGIGGGIVCDMTGFIAHIFMRGIRFGLIPTTLLAMSDAAIGGKNGVNFNENKNMIGSFDNPDFIIADSRFIQTLSEPQYMSGLGEIIKYALIGNNKILNLLAKNAPEIRNRDSKLIGEIIKESIISKTKIVEADPDDKSIRHILNFGHTVGHSIEIRENIPHGIAIVKGMNAACDISEKIGILQHDKALRIKNLLSQFGYDISYHIDESNIKILRNDKKKDDTEIRFVLLKDIGEPTIQKMKIDDIVNLIR